MFTNRCYDRDNDINNNYSSNNINRINFSDNILICPYCYTKNLFERDADELIHIHNNYAL